LSSPSFRHPLLHGPFVNPFHGFYLGIITHFWYYSAKRLRAPPRGRFMLLRGLFAFSFLVPHHFVLPPSFSAWRVSCSDPLALLFLNVGSGVRPCFDDCGPRDSLLLSFLLAQPFFGVFHFRPVRICDSHHEVFFWPAIFSPVCQLFWIFAVIPLFFGDKFCPVHLPNSPFEVPISIRLNRPLFFFFADYLNLCRAFLRILYFPF